jgi:hypothetical protein
MRPLSSLVCTQSFLNSRTISKEQLIETPLWGHCCYLIFLKYEFSFARLWVTWSAAPRQLHQTGRFPTFNSRMGTHVIKKENLARKSTTGPVFIQTQRQYARIAGNRPWILDLGPFGTSRTCRKQIFSKLTRDRHSPHRSNGQFKNMLNVRICFC